METGMGFAIGMARLGCLCVLHFVPHRWPDTFGTVWAARIIRISLRLDRTCAGHNGLEGRTAENLHVEFHTNDIER